MKSTIISAFSTAILCFVLSCSNTPKEAPKYVSPAIQSKDNTHVKFSAKDVDNKMDPSCMMPLTAGIGDTLHYGGYVLGFCSTECKNEFFKDPKGNLALAQLKNDVKK